MSSPRYLDSVSRDSSTPALSVVLPTPDVFATVALTIAHLRAQTALDEIELVLVAPNRHSLAMPEGALNDFSVAQTIECGEGQFLCDIKAIGARAATGKIVAFAEDHCFPAPNWAEKLISAHDLSHAAVGPRFYNANPRTSLSWQDYLLNFGEWSERNESKEVTALPWHNTSYKRELLVAYGEHLGLMLAAEGLLMEDLKKQGHKLYFESGAHVYHLNTSRLLDFTRGFFYSGWLFGGLRSRSWTLPRRALQFLSSPLVPFFRLSSQVKHLYRSREVGAIPSEVRVLWGPTLLIGSTIHVIGEAIGYLIGPGDALRHKSDMESHRIKHLARIDLHDIAQREKDIALKLNAEDRNQVVPVAP
ncbi:hypothetical protein IAD21_02545 [Abditibacteriota bacterium]|nr:hypothetical protein IAD21_02545 [Abditibacteriota bacterium]